MSKECECPTEHTITKLGHCRSCPYYKSTVNIHLATNFTVWICGVVKHTDGTQHDYSWATYADDVQTYGVCRCGENTVSDALWNGP